MNKKIRKIANRQSKNIATRHGFALMCAFPIVFPANLLNNNQV
jgi:hypothetical protein